MLSEKERDFRPCVVSLEALVPEDNFYREVEEKLDLSFVRELVRHLYKPFGRPGIDPVVFFKLQLIMFFEGIRSERQLMDMVAMRLDCRWYISYDLNEPVPNHSSLTYIRKRFGLEVFQRFFEHIVELCIEAGLVWGKELYFDGTLVPGNASMDSLVPRVELHLLEQFENIEASSASDAETISDTSPTPSHSRGFIDKYNGDRLPAQHQNTGYDRIADDYVSATDPDATPLRASRQGHSYLGYNTHYVVDGGKARIILAALVTPASIMDNQPMLDLERWVRFRWGLGAEIAVGDGRYGSVDNIVGLFQDGLIPLTPRADYNRGKKFYSNDLFEYDPDDDVYYCPQGRALERLGNNRENQSVVYGGRIKVCRGCPVRTECTKNKRGRTIHRSYFQDQLDQAAAWRETPLYIKAMNKRKVWVEPLFGEGKQWHGLRRFRWRRLWRVNIEALLIASVQNLKRLLKGKHHHYGPRPPANPNEIRVVSTLFFL